MSLNRKHFAEFFRTDFNVVSVVFLENLIGGSRGAQLSGNPKRYSYKVSKDLKIAEGELLLVCTSNSPEDLNSIESLKVVKVVSFNTEPEIDGSACFNYKWIVGKLDDAMVAYQQNVEKDNKLKRAVAKLESALERVSLKKQIETALAELAPEESEELRKLFGTDLLGNDGKNCSKLEQS